MLNVEYMLNVFNKRINFSRRKLQNRDIMEVIDFFLTELMFLLRGLNNSTYSTYLIERFPFFVDILQTVEPVRKVQK